MEAGIYGLDQQEAFGGEPKARSETVTVSGFAFTLPLPPSSSPPGKRLKALSRFREIGTFADSIQRLDVPSDSAS